MSVTTNDDLGEITRAGDKVTIVFHRRISRPVAKVWAALTVPERVSIWFAQTRIDRLEPGGVMQLDFPEENYRSLARIVICEPMRTFAWAWSELDGSKESLVRWDLESDGDGCRLTLTHSDLTPEEADGVGSGWHAHLQAIQDAADGVATPWSEVRARADRAKPLYEGRVPAA